MGNQAECSKNIIVNPNFDKGLQGWSASYGSTLSICDLNSIVGCRPCNGKHYVSASKRSQSWQGVEQNLTVSVKPNVKYKVSAIVRISAPWELEADILATLKLEGPNSYMQLGRVKASKKEWVKLQGTLLVRKVPENVIFYLEGPPPGVDLLVDSVQIKPEDHLDEGPSTKSQTMAFDQVQDRAFPDVDAVKVVHNSSFEDGLQHWSGRFCKISLCEVMHNPVIRPCKGRYFAVVSNRTASWQGIQQELTGRLEANISYDVNAEVRIRGKISTAEVLATLLIKKKHSEEKYITLGRVEASTEDWVCLQGRFILPSLPDQAITYLEGPAPGIDILVDSFSVCPTPHPKPSPPPTYEDPKFGVNILQNSNLLRGLDHWYGLGSCSVELGFGAPKVSPPSARDSLQCQTAFSGKYILTTGRKFTWEGPAQTITKSIQLFLPYQVSAWVRVGEGGSGVQKVNVALSIDGQWVTGGEVYAAVNSWKEVAGSFRLENEPKEVMVYVQGPSPQVDLMVANLQILPVDRTSRMNALKSQTEKVRKRDVLIELQSPSEPLSSVTVEVKQTKNSFPIGSCINRYSLDNQDYVDFFLKHFNYTVFENELKWQWNEPSQGTYNYADADALCDFCSSHDIPVRGHCIFWEVEHNVQTWLKNLSKNDLAMAVQNRVVDLVSRYYGQFQHYDVNNEMLHGNFYTSKLGPEIIPHMFQLTHQFDPSAVLFVNDYHVEDGRDADSSPEEYILQIQNLLSQGALVGGIGLQGHSNVPIGAILCQTLDKLSVLGLPIWLTEVDVSSSNEFVRADDLEVVLREAYGHPEVEGIILWGFWEGCMSRDKAHLVNCDKTLTEAGKRFIDLKEEWMSNFVGNSDAQGQIQFRGFYGSYTVTVHTSSGVVEEQFELIKGDDPLIVKIGI
ncbi:hypothetical protein O6H91_06G123100 [Diphasiastrum complanatum]|uniref:Uncharacterized protein n=1 Tax=Diphasiastrum complanatum TaxID=34168 RepID=A0ACC2DID7_DIPCM|nr:hypothetical protein O6H91_06G123100 [Diphasiastrum complanatum]